MLCGILGKPRRIKFFINKRQDRNSLAVKGLGLHAILAQGLGSIPAQGTKIPQAVQHTRWGRGESGDLRVGDVSPRKVPEGPAQSMYKKIRTQICCTAQENRPFAFNNFLKIYLFLVMLGLCCCAWAFSS